MKNEDTDEERVRISTGLAYFAYMKVYSEGLNCTFDNISYRLTTDDTDRSLIVTNLHTNEETKITLPYGYSTK